jgi:hypothetical protein
MISIFAAVEEMYFHNPERYKQMTQGSLSHTYLAFLESSLVILLSMQRNVQSLLSSKGDEIKEIDSQNDPKVWRSKGSFRDEFNNTYFIMNFLGNNQSQIDLSRRIKKHAISDQLFSIEVYKQMINTHISAPEISFLNNLRNYLQHYSVPCIHWQFKKSFTENKSKYSLIIDKNDLVNNRNNCFKADAKKFIKAHDSIRIDCVMQTVIDHLFQFYIELFSKIFKNIKRDLFDYLYIIECKNQIANRIRKEDFLSSDDEVGCVAEAMYQKLFDMISTMEENTFDFLYEIHCLVAYTRV